MITHHRYDMPRWNPFVQFSWYRKDVLDLDKKGRYARNAKRIDRKLHQFNTVRDLPKMSAPKKTKIIHIVESSARRI